MTHTLQEELTRDFLEQKKAINEQLLLVDPMATSLRKPAARRLFHNGLIILLEIVMWLLFIACIAFIFLMDKLYPFFLIGQLMQDSAIKDHFNHYDMSLLDWTIKGMVAVIALLFVIMARMLGAIRMKNTILNVAGRNMKSLAEQMLHRKAVMESMAQRHPLDLPSDSDSIVVQNQKPHNDILL
jgi:hypothetical protein